ncbi:MAG: DUF4386 domain-containing protein [Acidimicrobiia bacterium]|nr:DUF4386 domain-containing protein [Acidimicrobiia bacterium]
MTVSWKKVTGWAGIAYVVIFLALFAFTAQPASLTDSAAEFRQWFVDNETSVAVVTFGLSLAFALVVVFASGLRSLLGPVDEDSAGMWSRVSFVGAVMMVAMGGVGLSFWAVLGLEDTLAAASDDTVKTLAHFDTVIFSAIVPWGMALFVLGASLVILRSGVMSKWLGWLGLFVAGVAVVGTLWPFSGDSEGFFAIIGLIGFPPGFLIWSLWAAISMIRMDGAPGR